jgi:uncharacterized protein (TIGR02996 family)
MEDTNLVNAIVADPNDDAVRLVYADWLEEHDQPDRAEFIRGQIQLARLSQDSLPRRRLARRVREVLERRRDEWLSPVIDDLRYWHFERGLIDKIGIDARCLERRATELFSSLPLTRLWVLFMDMDMEDLERLPIPARLFGKAGTS